MWLHTKWCLLAPDANDGGTESSTVSPAAPAAADAKGAESSSAEGAEASAEASRASLDTALAGILKKHEAMPDEETEGDGEVETDAALPEETPDEEVTEEGDSDSEEGETDSDADDAKVPFHEHPRWKELQTQLKAAKADASRMSKIDTYCQQYGVTEDQVGQALEMAALLNNDPVEAYKRITELGTALASYAGDKLPADLEKAVKDGVVAPEYAKRMAKLEAEVNLMKRQGQIGQQRTAEQQRTAMVKSLNVWEQSVSSRDPDFKRKAELVEAKFVAMATKMPPRSAEEAVALADQAYSAVNKHLAGFAPAPAKRAGPNGSSKKPLAEPTTPQEVVARVMRKYLK